MRPSEPLRGTALPAHSNTSGCHSGRECRNPAYLDALPGYDGASVQGYPLAWDIPGSVFFMPVFAACFEPHSLRICLRTRIGQNISPHADTS